MKKKLLFFFGAWLSLISAATAQVTILSSGFVSSNVTPASMLQVTIMNSQTEVTATLQAEITNASGVSVIKVTSLPFTLNNGINQLTSVQVKTAMVTYALNDQASFVQTHKMLPSGSFNYCVQLTTTGSEQKDEYCDVVQSDYSSFLSLVSPFDQDILDTKNPLLIWTHSEPFSVLAQGEFFRIVVVEKQNDQTTEAAVAANQPVFFKNAITQHEIQYPFDSKQLEEGKTYAWQVQKIGAGGQQVIDKTEAWQFTIKKTQEPIANKYALLRNTLNGDYYSCTGHKLYFRFDEEYQRGDLTYEIRDASNKILKAEIKHDGANETITVRHAGVNRFELDVTAYHLKEGFYTLIIYNRKHEKHYLRFTVTQ